MVIDLESSSKDASLDSVRSVWLSVFGNVSIFAASGFKSDWLAEVSIVGPAGRR